MASGDILGVTVLGADPHNGWAVEVEIEGWASDLGSIIYDFGYDSDNLPTSSTPVLTVTSEGFDDAGTLGTIGRSVYLTKQIRKAYPNASQADERTNGSNLIVTCGLSAGVFDDDKDGGAGTSGTDPVIAIPAGVFNNGISDNASASGLTVTNNSTLDYPKPFGKWALPGYRLIDDDFEVEFVAESVFGQNAKPVACVEFHAEDESANSITPIVVTQETLSSHGTQGNPVAAYIATIPVSGLTALDKITVWVKIYPWVGDTAFDTSLAADGESDPTQVGEQYYLNDKSGTYGRSYAVVDSVSGNDGTGAVSGTSEAAAASTPYATGTAALTALKAYNNTNYGRNTTDGSVLALTDAGTHQWPGATSGTLTLGNVDCWTIIKARDGAGTVTIDTDTSHDNLVVNGWLYFDGIAFDAAGTGVLRGSTTTGKFCVDGAPKFANSGSLTTIYGWYEYYIINSLIGDVSGGFVNFSTNRGPCVLFRGNGDHPSSTTVKYVTEYCWLGNDGSFRAQSITVETYRPSCDGGILQGNRVPDAPDPIYYAADSDIIKGYAIIGNIFEGADINPQALVNVYADGNLTPTNQIIIHGNTSMGARTNLVYNDDGTVSVAKKNTRYSGNVVYEINIKSDTFTPGNAARTGNWMTVFGVNVAHNHSYQTSAFELEFAGLGRTTGDPGFVYDASQNSGDNSGNGDYTPDTGSVLKGRIPLADQYSRYDIFGTERADGGDIGAIETSVTLPAISVVPGVITVAGGIATVTTSVIIEVIPGEAIVEGGVATVSSTTLIDVVPGLAEVVGGVATITIGGSALIDVVPGAIKVTGAVVTVTSSVPTTAVWPATLPQAGLAGVSGGPQANVVSFEPDVGPSIDRRRASLVIKTFNVELPPLTQTQYETFLDFFDTTLVSGVLPFQMTDPFLQVAAIFKFKHGKQSYSEERITADLTTIKFQLQRLRLA